MDDIDIVYLNKENAKFIALGEDFISIEHDGKTYERVTLHRAMPFTFPDKFIVVKCSEGKEIGIIRDIEDFEERELLTKMLRLRYYSPKVLEVIELKDKFGFMYVKILTDSGIKNFASADLTKSIVRIEGDRYIIVDVEGNRFLIENMFKVKNYKKLIPYVV